MRFRTILVGLLFAFAFVVSARAGGVTIIAHGFSSNVTDWIIPMAGKIGSYPGFPGTSYSCYQITISRNGAGQLVAAATLIGGVTPLESDSGEIVVKLDWSSVSSVGGASSTAVAQATTTALLDANFILALNGHALAEAPLHLIGHSRGGSVVTEMARLLGAQGVWVDHVTTLDPRPVAQFSDAAVTSWSNVLFADNYWQTMGDGLIVPNGQSVFGATNRKLLNLSGGYSSSHSDVHLWYHGTIDLATPASDTQATINAAQRTSWWTPAEGAGASAGFLYSLIGGGDRLSNLEPAGAGNGRINDGFNRAWELGGGIAPNRASLTVAAGLWPNPIRFQVTTPSSITAGQSFTVTLYDQAGSSAAGEVALDLLLDPDANLFNGNEIVVAQLLLPRTGTNAVSLQALAIGTQGSLPPGSYAVCARLSDGGRSRYLYAPQHLTVTPTPSPPRIDAGSLLRVSGIVQFDVHAMPGQAVMVEATIDLIAWTPLQTHTFTGSVWQFVDGAAAKFDRRIYRVVLAP
ncbi:MAG: hypothetical protein ABI883_04765 [Chthoniobacterales bacterium]